MKRAISINIIVLMLLSVVLSSSIYCEGSEVKNETEEYINEILSCGKSHAALVDSDGTIKMWGSNKDIQLGYFGIPFRNPYSVIFDELENYKAVAAGAHHTVAIKKDGTVWMSDNYKEPYQVENLEKVSAVSAGFNFSVAVENGKVWCWQFGSAWQLGLENIRSVSAGYDHALALSNTGKVYAWGDNQYGQLGNELTSKADQPVVIEDLQNIKSISAGQKFSAALTNDGSVMVWGNLPWNDTDNVKKAPVELEGLSDIKEIACGYDHMLALKSDGTVWAIGLNKYGQLGDGSKNARNTPVMVKNIDNISTVSAGDSFSLAMTNDGSLWAWGLNNMGQLRDMTYYDSVIPVLCYVDKEKPSAPYDIEVEVVGGSAHLSWKGSKDNTGVLKYYIFRDGEKISSEDDWDYYDQQWYTDEGLKVGESFDYFVKVIDFEGNMSEASETIRIDIGKDTQPPDIPEDIRVYRNAETDTFTILWSYCYDDFEVKEYELIMNGKTIASGSHFRVDTFDGCPTSVLYDLNFDFEIGEKYVFTVKAIDTSGNFSESEPFEFFDSYGNSIKDAFFVSVVDNVYGKILNGKIDYIDDVDFLSFKVNSSGTYTIKTESDNKISLSLSDSEENIINRINGKNSSFTADLIKGEDYYLEIGDAWYYTPGYRICFIKEDNTPPTEVTDLSLAVKNGSIALNWSASKDNIGVKGYRVYRNDEEIGVTDIPYFADEDMGNTEKYKYMVKAFDFSGNLSKERNIAGNLTDLVVEAVNAPKTAYSGGKLSIDWVVKNVGYTDTTDTLWYDSIYISQSNVFDVNTSELLGRVANKSFLAEAESYRAEEEFDLPKGISGEYYIHVITDSYDKLYELKASNNAGISEAFNVILSPSPDLKVTSITVPSTSFTGMAVEVAWTVKNQGDGATEGTWRDKIYISKAPNFDEGNARLIGSKTYNLRLAAGEEYSEKMDVSIIDAVYGNHYIFVEADANNSVYEHAGEANNVSEAAEINLVLRPYADLEVVSVSAADSTVAGSSIDVSWRVENKGFASTVEGSWTDCIYVSTSPYLDGSAVAVATVYHSGNLVKGESYTVEKNILLPKGLSGKYYILVYSDYSNKVFEFNSKDNNVGLSKAIDIKPAVIDAAKDIKEDVAIINAEISHSEANSGESVNVKWEVRNVSEDDMERERWVDGVYLSKSGNLDNGDYTILASSSNNIILSSGEGYSRDINVEIPKGISGKYYIIVSSDIYRSIYDVNRENNTYCISTPLNISLSPSPDIKLASVTTEVYGISGQPLDISWEVLNKGNAPTDSLWYDSVYLSKDEFYDNNDSCLSSMKNKKQLNVGESYSNTSTIEIPSEVSGNYYLLLRADSRDDIYEYNAEENNIEVVNVEIIKLPPADLKVHSIHVPEKAVPGEKVTINWNVVNKGISKAKGYMTDSIYISEDKTWDINDIHFGDLRYSIDLETNFEVENHLTSEMPGTVPGDYYVIIQTDILNQIPESNNLNNAGVSVETINADMKKLKMGETEEFYLNRGSYRYYKISAEEGTDILVKLDSKSEISSNELFVSYGEVPDRGSFDYCFAIQNEADQEIIIPDTKQGDYYITAYCSAKTDAGNLCTLEARVMDFQLRRLGINEGGQGGTVTVELHGTKMSSDVKALLKNDSSTVSSSVYWVNNSLILATFDLSEAPLGIYDVIISEDEKESILEDSFTVAKTKFNALEVDTSLPRNITPWSIGLFEVNYYNAGNTNSYTPVLKISADNALLKLNDESDFKVNNVIVPVESKYLPDIIKPGDRGIIYVFFKPTSSSGTNINFTVENIKNILSDTDEKSEAIEAEGAQSVENEIEYVSTTSSLLSEAYDENEMKIPDSIAFSANTDELEIINYDNVYRPGYKLIQWDKPLQPSSWYNVKDKTSGGDALKKMEVNNSFKCE
ncbi:MAG: hypothetical protein GX660_18160, partial [Clostridiaceae bacterium]|nr:hypothetical protein [Clostridiaceae bacterium]